MRTLDLKTVAILVAILVAIVTTPSGYSGDEVVVEGSISVGTCGAFPPLPVCVLRDASDGAQYALIDFNGDGVHDISDALVCLNNLRRCERSVRVTGTLERLECDPIEGFGMDGIRPTTIEVIAPECGDANGSGAIDLSDAITILDGLFGTGTSGNRPCPGSSDVNGDGHLDISDAIFLLDSLFLGGPAPRCP